MRFAFAIGLFWNALPVRAAEPVDNDFFEKKVRPLLIANCIGCHGSAKQKGELRLDSREAMLKGGDNGPAVKPGEPDKSLLIRAIRFDDEIRMPKKGKMTAEEIAVFTAWVKGGAPWPAGTAATQAGPGGKFDLQARAKAHWSFQPIRRPAVPEIHNPKSTIPNPIDAFLLAKLDAAGLKYSPPADKRVLIRRVYLDVIGLPPTAAEIDAFVTDQSPEAYEKLIDQLLASPHYGERWARHWLDLVRYAETFGHEFDFEIADAWRYRDYVIQAFNADVPYNQFLTEHIAGDLLDKPRRNPKDSSNESIIATGFWWLGESKHSPVDSRGDYADRIDNQIDVFGKTVLGLTLACARCHDHKFDPIATKDYYALFSVLASSRFQRADVGDPDPSREDARRDGRTSPFPRGSVEPKSLGATRRQSHFGMAGKGDFVREVRRGLAEALVRVGARASHREHRLSAQRPRGPQARRGAALADIHYRQAVPGPSEWPGATPKSALISNGIQLIQNPIYGWLAQVVNHGEELRWLVFDLRMWKGQPAYSNCLTTDLATSRSAKRGSRIRLHPQRMTIRKSRSGNPPPTATRSTVVRILELEGKLPDPRRAPAICDGTGRDEKVFIRGNHKTLGADAPRAFLEAFGKPAFTGPGSGRLELAATVTDPDNPLVARVLVNRLWQHHFGEGIVRSPDDFGYQGQRPTHPELLDWLASQFVARGWSHQTNAPLDAELRRVPPIDRTRYPSRARRR